MFGRFLLICGILYLIGIFQSSFLLFFFPNGVAPNLLLIVLVFLVALGGFTNALTSIVVAGVVMDVLSLSRIGLNVILFIIIGLVVVFLAKRLSVSQSIWRFFILISLVGVASMLSDLMISGWVVFSETTPRGALTVFNLEILKRLISNMGVAILLYKPLKGLINSGMLACKNSSMIIRRT